MRDFLISDAVVYLRKKHQIDLTSSALRRHLPSSKRQHAPTLKAQQLSIGFWVTSAAALDSFAEQYKTAQATTNPKLGKTGRKRPSRA